MRKTHVALIAVLATSLMALCSLNQTVNVCYALPGPRIYLNPSNSVFYSNQTAVGHRFNVTVWIENATLIGAAQITLEFNESIVNVTRWFEPKTDLQYIFKGRSTNALPAPPNDVAYNNTTPGKARIKLTILLFPPDPPYINGTGKFCLIELVVNAPLPDDMLTCPLNLVDSDTYLADGDTGNEVPNVAKEDGSYTYTVPEFTPALALCLVAASSVAILLLKKKHRII